MIFKYDVRQVLENITKAIEKGVGEDTRSYIEENDTVTTNAVPHVRSDKINTNLSNRFKKCGFIDIKIFHRTSWKGILIIDNEHKIIFTVCTRGTLDRIVKNENRSNPHYMQTLLHTLNVEEIPHIKQMSLCDFGLEAPAQFSGNTYKEDFVKILDSDPSFYDGYRYWLIIYEAVNFMVTSVDAVLMDKNFNIVDKVSLLEYLKPNFAELTVATEEKTVKDGHSLVSIKAGLKGKRASEPDKKVKIYPKTTEEECKKNN